VPGDNGYTKVHINPQRGGVPEFPAGPAPAETAPVRPTVPAEVPAAEPHPVEPPARPAIEAPPVPKVAPPLQGSGGPRSGQARVGGVGPITGEAPIRGGGGTGGAGIGGGGSGGGGGGGWGPTLACTYRRKTRNRNIRMQRPGGYRRIPTIHDRG